MVSILKESVDPVAKLRAFIVDGGYVEGGRLPPERELTGALGMTRTTLRKALDALERDGVIWRHVGKGTFVAGSARGMSNHAFVELGRQLTPFRMVRARLAIEPAIAREAAINATGDSLQRMRQTLSRSRMAANWNDYEIQDDLFHHAVAEASDNLLLLSLFDQLNQVRRAVAWGNVARQTVRPPTDHTSFEEHNEIVDAIEGRDPQAAYDAMREHLRSVSERLFGEI